MRFLLLLVAMGALITATCTPPAIANVVAHTKSASAHPRALVAQPIGCATNGPNSYDGVDPYETDFSGGAGTRSGYIGFAFVGNGSYNEACDGYSFIGNGDGNIIGGDNESESSAIVEGGSNTIEASSSSFIGAGAANAIGNGTESAIVAGGNNSIGGPFSFLGGGSYNSIIPTGTSSVAFGTIAGGYDNVIGASAYGTIAGGASNTVNGQAGSIIGGQQNSVPGEYGTAAGGYLNIASGVQSAIGGGYGNIASGKNGTIPGGSTNVASGANSFAAGYRSTAGYTGDFVWSDYVNGSTGVSATAEDQFLARATGGFYLYSSKSLTGVALAPGSGSWSTLSDRNVKTGIQNVDETRILVKLAAMPVSEWSYKAQGNGIRHVGPMAQDFRAAFGLGEDDRHISTVDEEGVALAAIKALHAENAILRAEHVSDEARIARLEDDDAKAKRVAEDRLAHLEARLDAIESTARSARSR